MSLRDIGWKRGLLIAVGVVAVIVLLATTVFSSDSSSAAQSSGGSGGGQDTLRAEGYVVDATSLTDRIFTTGTLRANEGVDLVSEASGKVTRILFQEGSRVGRGQLLVEINNEEWQAQRERLRYEAEMAQRRAERERALLERGGVSEQSYEETANQVNVLQAQIQETEAQIEKRLIRAPFSGVVGLRYVSPGSYVSPQSRIASLRDIDPIKIDLSVPERYGPRINENEDIQFSIAGTDRTFRATVYAVEPSVREETRAVQVRARAANSGGVLKPGGFADVEVIFERIDNALVVPSIAVLPERNRRRVFVANGGMTEPRYVQTGIRTDSTVQITSGLSTRDTVLVSGLQTVRPNQPVVIDTLVNRGIGGGVQGVKRSVEANRALPN